MEQMNWAQMSWGKWHFYIAKNNAGLCYVGVPNETFDQFSVNIKKRYKKQELIENKIDLAPFENELIEYLNGERTQFSLPLNVKGTEFQKQVWKALQLIPFGTVYTYSDIAKRIGRPKSVRAVGTAIGANPILIVIPCHRVIGKDGSLTGFRGGLEMKKALLQIENTKINK